MGQEVSTYKNYTIGQPFPSNSESADNVVVAPATSPSDGKKYTVFQYPKAGGTFAENRKHVEVLKTIRHPHVVKFITTFENSKKLTLVTENVTPLDVAIERQEKEDIFVGLYNILEALVFLHDRSNICHNGVSVSNVFVAENGDWKISAFQKYAKIQRLSKQSYDNDIIGYGEFALSVLEYLRDESPTTVNFMQKLRSHFSEEAKESLGSLKSLLGDKIFDFPYMKMLLGLKTLPLMSSTQKLTFFRSLEQNLHGSPSMSVCRRCIPVLFSPTILSDPSSESFIKFLFSSGNEYCVKKSIMPLFDKEYFVKHSLPCILELFQQREATIRLIILKNLPLYVDCIDKMILKDEVLPELLVGLQDTNDVLIAATLKALSLLVPLLGGDAVVGRHGMKLFFNRQPNFKKSTERDSGKTNDLNTSPTISDEKRQRRTDREKQREEQRRKREERRKERESQQFKKIQPQSSLDETSCSDQKELSRPLRESPDSTTKEMRVEKEENLSEPDWEGFIANDYEPDDSVPKTNSNQWQDKPVNDSHARNGGITSLQDDNDDDDDADWNNDGWDDNGDPQSDYTEKVSALITKQNSIEHYDNNVIDKESTGSPMRISSASKNLLNKGSPLALDKSKTKTTPTQNNKTHKKSLGDEFDIKINMADEPDYFADMMPSFDEKSKAKTIVIEKKVDLSSKFQAVNDAEPDPGGWEDTNDWGDDF